MLLASLNNLAAEGPLRACAKSALHTPQLHETIMVSNLNEMLLLWNQRIDENAARLSISHLGCVFVSARLQACGDHVSQLHPPGSDVPPAASSFHLTVITLCHRRYEKRSRCGESSLSLSLFAPADITDQQPFSTRQAEEAQISNIST